MPYIVSTVFFILRFISSLPKPLCSLALPRAHIAHAQQGSNALRAVVSEARSRTPPASRADFARSAASKISIPLFLNTASAAFSISVLFLFILAWIWNP